MANGKLRVCIVGTGARGNAHAKAWAASGEAEVVAVVDVLEDRARELAAAYDAPHVFTDYHEAVQRDDIDVVSICTPAFYHEEVTIFAAEHGKHMLSEKPIAMRLDQADRMIAALEASGVVFVINFQSRFGDAPAAVRQCYATGPSAARSCFACIRPPTFGPSLPCTTWIAATAARSTTS